MPYHVGEKGSYGCSGYPAVKDDGEVMGCHETREKAEAQITAINISEAEKINVNRLKPTARVGTGEGAMVSSGDSVTTKNDGTIKEGDFVTGPTADGIVYGKVEHIMWEGGTLGTPGDEYALESMPPENPAMSVRVYDEEDGIWEATPYSIGMMYQDAKPMDGMYGRTMEDDAMEMLSKQFWNNIFDPRQVENNAKISKLWD